MSGDIKTNHHKTSGTWRAECPCSWVVIAPTEALRDAEVEWHVSAGCSHARESKTDPKETR